VSEIQSEIEAACDRLHLNAAIPWTHKSLVTLSHQAEFDKSHAESLARRGNSAEEVSKNHTANNSEMRLENLAAISDALRESSARGLESFAKMRAIAHG
jgi:hypothetical protein